MQIKTLGDESPSYQERREELRLAELAMTEHIERVAALRRMLPDGPPVRDSAQPSLESPRSHTARTPGLVRGVVVQIGSRRSFG
jgi:hypothetical protein